MERTKVWWAPGDLYHGPQIRLNPGEARDNGGTGKIEYELAYDGNLDELLKTHHIVYRVYDKDYETLPWAFSEEEAHRIANELGVPADACQQRHIMLADILPPVLKPMVFPITTTLYKNDRGLFCRLNIHPEIDGSYGVPGKLFFPDKTCADKLCEGPCVITSVKDKGNYGFFTAHMRQFEIPDDAALDKYIREQGIYSASMQYTTSKFGNYIVLICRPEGWDVGYVKLSRGLAKDEEGNVEEITDHTVLEETTAKITKEISVADYLCNGYHDCNFNDLYNRFVQTLFKSRDKHLSTKYISELFDDAVADGFLIPLVESNIFYVEIDKNKLIHALMNYSREEMSELIDTVNKINQTANNAIKGKIKRGQFSIG